MVSMHVQGSVHMYVVQHSTGYVYIIIYGQDSVQEYGASVIQFSSLCSFSYLCNVYS